LITSPFPEYNTSYNFNTDGNLIAIVAAEGMLAISEVDSGQLVYIEKMKQTFMRNLYPSSTNYR
jgi:hypothetical protein